jgi:hypothetical protein
MTGDTEALKRISENPSFLMLVPFRGEPKPLHKASLAGAIMIISTVIATLNILPLEIVFLTGALVMILSGCISTQQAYQSIDSRIYVFIAGAIPLGLAMQETGTADPGGLAAGTGLVGDPLDSAGALPCDGPRPQIMSDAGTLPSLADRLAPSLDLPRTFCRNRSDGGGNVLLYSHRSPWKSVDLWTRSLSVLRLRPGGCAPHIDHRRDRLLHGADALARLVEALSGEEG